MPFAFGHLIGAWFVGKLFQKVRREKLSHLGWGLILFGGLLPDGDLVLDWILGTTLHRTFSHSVLFAIIAVLLVYLVARGLDWDDPKTLGFALGAGVLTHLFLDFFSTLGVPLLWPSLWYFSPLGLAYNSARFGVASGSIEVLRGIVQFAILDMGLGVLWLMYLWYRKRIEF